ncbi:MAG: SAM-dependent methyltransferase [Oscillospiraceae bacterium]|nr:SAM-dependent methyltransferase [Oscillospiraceae bacterium]
MDARLEAIYRLIPPGKGVIDVGTDHAYLPVRLALDGYAGRILASDLREGPLATARRTAAQAGVSAGIGFVLADGLAGCDPDAVDTIVIAGMGGDTICGILDRAEWCMSPAYRLILQPMTKAEVLRYWLSNNGFAIEDEVLEEDAGTIYQITAARYCGTNETLSDAELYLGKRGLADPVLYRRLVDDLIGKVSRRLDGLRGARSMEDRPIRDLERRLLELTEMRKEYDDDCS